MANTAFIAQVAPIAQRAYRDLGKIRPSVCIAMACVESGWGTAGSCKYHSYLGFKVGSGRTATKYWGGKSFNSRTKECYDQATGALTEIRSNFRAYDSLEQCVFNYYELMNTSLYAGVTDCDPYDQIQQIKNCGYFTSTTEVSTVRKIIEQYDLETYDVVTPEPIDDRPNVGYSVVAALDYLGAASNFEAREKLAAKAGIVGYTGTSEQNLDLLHYVAIRALRLALDIMEG